MIRDLNQEIKEAREIQTAVAKIANSASQKLDHLNTSLTAVSELAEILKENNKHVTHLQGE
jgi:uncharacterized protein YoxC